MQDNDAPLRVSSCRFAGDEPIGETGRSVADFWRWSCDLLENVQRGIFAEYIVAVALDATDQSRIGWDGYDVSYGAKRIEVKCSAYLQSWQRKRLSRPTFGIGAREQWDEETGTYSDPRYVADAFVFCLLAHRDRSTVDILDLTQWEFFVVNTETLKDRFPLARSLSEDRLRSLTTSVQFRDLRARVDDVLANPEAHTLKTIREVKPALGEEREALYTYAVAQRATRAHPVIVVATDYRAAFDLARADATIATYGIDISAIRLTGPTLEALLTGGAVDLRPRR